MKIIEEFEPCARGFYTGAIGWTELGGRSRFNLAIRTAVVSATGLTYHAGGGIIADSDPEKEYEETLLKSENLLPVSGRMGLKAAGTGGEETGLTGRTRWFQSSS